MALSPWMAYKFSLGTGSKAVLKLKNEKGFGRNMHKLLTYGAVPARLILCFLFFYF